MKLSRRLFFGVAGAATVAPKAVSAASDDGRTKGLDAVEEYRLRVARLDAQGIKPIKTAKWRSMFGGK